MIFFDEQSLRTATSQFVSHYHAERNHQGLGFETRLNFRPYRHWQQALLSEDLYKTVNAVLLRNADITNTGLMRLKALPCLEFLSLDNTQVSDTGLVHLTAVNNILVLILSNTRITDGGLPHLRNLANLQILDLQGTNVTDESVKKLQHALPKCKILH